jgi:hypothetical protein
MAAAQETPAMPDKPSALLRLADMLEKEGL